MMRKITLLLVTILANTSLTGSVKCSNRWGIKLNTRPQQTEPLRATRLEVETETFQLKWDQDIVLLRATTTYLYCPAVEFGLFTDCHSITVTNKDLSGLIYEKSVGESFCMVPNPCDSGTCDGWTREQCFDGRPEEKLKSNAFLEGKLSSSWISHRCTRNSLCESLNNPISLVYYNATHFRLHSPEEGDCVSSITSAFCCWQEGFCAKIFNLTEERSKKANLVCVETEFEEYCMDKEENVQLKLGSDGNGYYEHKRYKVSNVISKHRKENKTSINKIASSVSMESIYEALEMDFLMSEINTHILELRIRELESIATLNMMGPETTMETKISELLKLSLMYYKSDKDSHYFFVCPEFKSKEKPLPPLNMTWQEVSLFNQTKSVYEVKRHPMYESFTRGMVGQPSSYNVYKTKHGDAPIVNVKWLSFSALFALAKEYFILGSCFCFWIHFILIRKGRS